MNEIQASVAVHRIHLPRARTTAFSLFERPSMSLVVEGVLYLDHLAASGAAVSYQRNVAYSLSHWLTYCRQLGLDFRRVAADDLVNYIRSMEFEISPQTQEEYSTGTIKTRVGAIAGFYEWGSSVGWNKTALDLAAARKFSQQESDHDSSQPLGASSTKFARRTERAETDVHPLDPTNQATLLDALGPRDRLTAEWMLFCGLRIEEVLGKGDREPSKKARGLRVHQFAGFVLDSEDPFDHSPLTVRGKYNKKRTIAVPNWLLISTQAYIANERSIAVSRSRNPTPLLFVYGPESGQKHQGAPVKIRQFERILEKACIRTGLSVLVEKRADASEKPRLVHVAKHSPHDLRHSYAVNEYFARKARGETEPWKAIQAQLGHKYIQTTINTYLAWVSAHSGWERSFKRASVRNLAGIEIQHATT